MGNICGHGVHGPSMRVEVKTGDKKGAGTDSNIKLALVSQKGDISKEFPLSLLWQNDFEAGTLDDFEIQVPPEFKEIVAIELWRDSAGLLDDWYVEWLTIREAGSSGENFVFPIHRWITANKKLRITEFDTVLPQDDPNPNHRRHEVQIKKEQYQTKVYIANWLPQLKHLPSDEKFSNEYLWDIASMKIKLSAHLKLESILTGKWENYDEIFHLYNDVLTKPLGSETWKSDESFGLQRLNHCNPTQIRRCRKIPDNFAVTDDMLSPLLEGLTISQAIQANRLYYVDYKVMKDLPCAEGRIIAAPLALFFVNGAKKLLPVAIQLFQDPSESNPVFLPSDDFYTWLLAKMWFNNADSNFHQSCTHLGFTHLIMEPFALAAHRSLSPSHPMFRLLAPHFLYLLAINKIGISVLLEPGGWVDSALTVGSKGMTDLMARQLQNWRLDVQGNLPADLKERGVDDPQSLPNYYYRDDAMPTYEAIKEYVSKIVNNFYGNADLITGDYELQDWARTLSMSISDGGFGVPGIPGDGEFKNADQLVDTLTCVIFTCSVAHAACNFSQYDDYGFPPNYPSYLQGAPITSKVPRTEDDIHNALPSKETTIDILTFSRILSTRETNSLGNFEVKYLFDPASESALQRFREKLNRISASIDRENQFRFVPYTYLNPNSVPNAISI
ncbi:polyunsaturated fatty acid 5-lipoxygenase-like [Apostichopus japonicus]|uniref:polyunsaturated fatty acid 5-lipoxygenase-like n=1 Tax=Stichopus japonicus TaxID=307972 RepID=UPI003AB568CE